MDVGMSLQGMWVCPLSLVPQEEVGKVPRGSDETDVETFIFLWLAGCVCRKAL